MGSSSRQGSALTTLEAIDQWNQKAVVMVGIAFGRDSGKQKFTDVLVSEAIIPYEFERISEFEVISRAKTAVPGSILLERSRTAKRSFNSDIKVHHGGILSGEKLIDNEKFKSDLLNKYKEAIGGEMEGTGLYAACSRRNITEWLLVKGICDWGDGTKAKEYQKPAANAAVAFINHMFSNKNAFANLGFKTVDFSKKHKYDLENHFKIDDFIRNLDENLWRDNNSLRTQIGYLVGEVCQNALEHGGATECILEYINKGITIKYDGTKFDLKQEYEANQLQGGSYTLDYIIKKQFDKVGYIYEYYENKNIIQLIDISGTLMDFEILNNCTVNITPGDYSNYKRELFLSREIPVPDSCNNIIINLQDKQYLFMMSHRSDLINEILSRASKNITLEILVEDDDFTRGYFEKYETNDRVKVRYV
jgi:nucleoside phosphorylase